MSELTERVSYLEGLVRGLDVGDRDAQSRVWQGIVSVLGDLAREMDALQEGQGRLESYVGDVDEDLMEIENALLGDDDAVPACAVCGQPIERHGDEESLELICPECGETTFDPDEPLSMNRVERDGEDLPH